MSVGSRCLLLLLLVSDVALEAALLLLVVRKEYERPTAGPPPLYRFTGLVDVFYSGSGGPPTGLQRQQRVGMVKSK